MKFIAILLAVVLMVQLSNARDLGRLGDLKNRNYVHNVHHDHSSSSSESGSCSKSNSHELLPLPLSPLEEHLIDPRIGEEGEEAPAPIDAANPDVIDPILVDPVPEPVDPIPPAVDARLGSNSAEPDASLPDKSLPDASISDNLSDQPIPILEEAPAALLLR